MPDGAVTRRTALRAAASLGGLLVRCPAPAREGRRRPLIGVLGNDDNPPWASFRDALRGLGYEDGRNVTIEWRWSNGFPDRLPALAADLVAHRPQVIVASGTQAVRAAKGATSTIPIVMALSFYPDRLGLVDSLGRPGGNVTGLSTIQGELNAKRLELLGEVSPVVSPLALMWNPANPVEQIGFDGMAAAARAADVSLRSMAVRSPDEALSMLSRLAGSGARSLMVFGNPVTYRARAAIAAAALRHRLPSIFDERLFVQAGGLMSYGPIIAELFRRAATYVHRILNGMRPADLPVEQPARFELVLSRTVAGQLGLNVPTSVWLRADEVIG
jgi:putative ABC transport system substrate-binding protein